MPHLTLGKKVLIVSSWAPPRPGGSAQHLYNFFSQFDARMYAIYTREGVMRVSEPGPVLPCAYRFFPRSSASMRVLSAAVSSVRTVAYGLRLVQDEQSEIIYTTSDTGGGLTLGCLLSIMSRTPLVLHFFDMYRGNHLPSAWNLLSWLIEPAVLIHASIAIFPNEAIHTEYCRRYPWMKEKFFCINNGSFQEPYESLRTRRTPHAPPHHIVATGSVYWAQEESMLCLAQAVHNTSDLVADLYVPRHVPEILAKKLAANKSVRLASAPPQEMARIQTKADILFIPLARPGESPVVTLTAVPGKLPEYLLAGRPIVLQAPEQSFMAQYAKREGFAHVVTSYDPAKLRDEIRRVIADSAYSEKLVRNSLATFSRFHDASKNALRIAQLLTALPTKRHAGRSQYNSR